MNVTPPRFEIRHRLLAARSVTAITPTAAAAAAAAAAAVVVVLGNPKVIAGATKAPRGKRSHAVRAYAQKGGPVYFHLCDASVDGLAIQAAIVLRKRRQHERFGQHTAPLGPRVPWAES